MKNFTNLVWNCCLFLVVLVLLGCVVYFIYTYIHFRKEKLIERQLYAKLNYLSCQIHSLKLELSGSEGAVGGSRLYLERCIRYDKLSNDIKLLEKRKQFLTSSYLRDFEKMNGKIYKGDSDIM
jgi:hypothetical protein